MSENFDNQHRNRYYGLRVGDIVRCNAYEIEKATVVEFGPLDNNAVYVQEEGQIARKVVAEWCEIITRIEDQN